MPTVRRLPIIAVLLAVFLPFAARASAQSHVKASLVAADASVQAGNPVTVALHFVHDPHWHTYWISPGTGLPTSLEWKLPPGWKAGEIQWPTPLILRDRAGLVIGNGYENDLLLPVTLTPPADLKAGDKVQLNASADWLMCEEVCIPGNATVSLTLPVSTDAPKPDATWGEKIRATVAALPVPDTAWKVAASHDAKFVTLTLKAAAGAMVPKDLHFFAEDGYVAYDQPQKVADDRHGNVVLTLPIAADAEKTTKKLAGVLASGTNWLANGARRGLRIDADFSAGTTSTQAAGTATVAGGATSGGAAASGGTLFGTLALAFMGGLILNLMPCVFPVLGIKILGFVNQSGRKRSKVVTHGIVFTLGVLLSFWALAGALAALRAGGDQLGWGFQLQSPAFVYALAVLLLVFGLNMSGLFEFGLSAPAAVSNAPWIQQKTGYSESFFTGVLATAVATPCSAPFLAPALGAALAVSAVESFTIFTVIALGLSTPYLLLSIFPQAVKILPRPGLWMETFKQLMAFPLYATVGYLIWVLAAQTSEEGFRGILFSLVLVAMAVWMYGRWRSPGATPGRARFGMASLVVVGAFGLWVGWPRTAVAQSANAEAPAVVWEPWSPEAVTKLRAEGRIVYVDFTARWCATCQTNKKIVFHSDDVLKYFKDKKIVTLRGDWTSQDPRITAELASFNRSAVPFNVVWMPGKDAPVILPELLTPGTVLDAIKAADTRAPGGKLSKS